MEGRKLFSRQALQNASASARSNALFCLPLAIFWLLLILVHFLDWGLGTHRGIALITLLLFVLWKANAANDSRGAGIVERLLFPAALALLIVGIGTFIAGLLFASPYDIGDSGVRSINALLGTFSNPYAVVVDEDAAKQPGYFFEGYKYFPLMFLLYLPAVSVLGAGGVYVTNFLFYGGTIWVIYKIAAHLHQEGSLADPLVPVVLYMSSLTILFENFVIGANDGIVAFFALAAILAALGNRDTTAALLLGCSIGTKWPVGSLVLLILLPLVQNRIAFCLWASLIPLATILPFLLWDFMNFISNTVVFLRYKLPDSTGFLTKISVDWVRRTAQIILISAFWGVWAYYVKRRIQARKARDGRDIIIFLAVLITILLLIPRDNHRNHLVWLIPILALSFGLKGRSSPAPTH